MKFYLFSKQIPRLLKNICFYPSLSLNQVSSSWRISFKNTQILALSRGNEF